MEGDKPTYVESIAVKDGLIAYAGELAGAKKQYGKARFDQRRQASRLSDLVR